MTALNDYLSHAQRLREAGQAFAIATVVRAERPTSAKPGAKAIITADRAITGWVGGSCAQPTVVREALRALQDGQPRLLRLCPPERLGQAAQDGVVEVALTCISGGTLEIYIEPHLLQPQLLVISHLLVAEALAALGKGLSYAVTVMGLDATKDRFPQADRVFDRLDFAQVRPTAQTYVVVASHGNYDEEALAWALQAEVAYVALVASRRRAAAVVDGLREAGVAEERLARLKFPAGLNIGAITPEEIALSILAEIVQARRLGAPTIVSEAQREQAPAVARDPVCGMDVEIAAARYVSQYAGQSYYFCAAGCKRSFEKEPEKYF